MTTDEAIAAINAGRPVAHESWPPSKFFMWHERGMTLNHVDLKSHDVVAIDLYVGPDAVRNRLNWFKDGWLVYSPPTIH